VNAARIEEAVWADVCQLLAEPERIEAEYRRRLERKDPGAQAREQARLKGRIQEIDRNIARLIDAYAEGLLDKGEFEPRISGIRQQRERAAKELQSQVDEESLQQEIRLISGHLKDFAQQVKAGPGQADWETRQKIVAALVRRVEVEGERVRVVYRVDTSPVPSNGQKKVLQHCSRRSDPSACQ
jgi:site-specific DNA recombinase